MLYDFGIFFFKCIGYVAGSHITGREEVKANMGKIKRGFIRKTNRSETGKVKGKGPLVTKNRSGRIKL